MSLSDFSDSDYVEDEKNDSFPEEEVLSLASDEESFFRNRVKSSSSESEEDNDYVAQWGSKKAAYYDDDADKALDGDDTVDQEEEDFEQETVRLQSEKIQSLTDNDFMDSYDPKSRTAIGTAEQEKEQETVWKNDPLEDHEVQQSPELLDLMEDFQSRLKDVISQSEKLKNRTKDDDLETSKGMQFLHFKNQLMISYLINLSYFFYLKSGGIPVKDHPVVNNLIENRLFIEKTKELESRLGNEISKLVKTMPTKTDSVFAKSLKPSIDDLDQDEPNNSSKGVYEIPRISTMPYSDYNEKKRPQVMSKKKISIMEEFMDEFKDLPEEIVDSIRSQNGKSKRELMEEEMLVRLPISKKEKKKSKESKTALSAIELTKDLEFDVNEPDSADEFYQEILELKANKVKSQPKRNYVQSDDEVDHGSKREADYKIIKNKGLTPTRKKEDRNPRVKRRTKYEQSLKKLKSFTALPENPANVYEGESTGIKKNLSRSVQFK